jgi:hypothetical protein
MDAVTYELADLASKGLVAFSPLLMHFCLDQGVKLPPDYKFWRTYCLTMLGKSDHLIVLKLPGWQESPGVQDEITFARDRGILISYINPAFSHYTQPQPPTMNPTPNNNPQKAIYKFHQDHGRMGSLEGIFVADPKEVKQLIDSEKDVYFGEVLGKHSEIYSPISDDEITMVSDDPAFVELFEAHDLSSGFCPFDYIEDVDEDDESN